MLKTIFVYWGQERFHHLVAMARGMPDKKIKSMHNIFARNNQDCVIGRKGAYRRDTPKPRKRYMEKQASILIAECGLRI
jgi:hypothetical protein